MDGQTPEAMYISPPAALWDAAEAVETPALIYDICGVRHLVREMSADISMIEGAQLNVALKACHTPAILSELSDLGLGCDVASIGELRLAQGAGFKEITATGPAFSESDFEMFRAAGVVVDVDSLSQLETYAEWFPGSEVGLRLRLPLLPEFDTGAAFGEESRFGIDITDRRWLRIMTEAELKIVSLHVHTGQTTPEAAVFKLDYLLSVAEMLPGVSLIDMGGGLFHFYADRAAAQAALSRMAERVTAFRKGTERDLQLRFEPGGAILAPFGYLVTEVRAVEEQSALGPRIVTVDSSAWNFAPWHKPQVFILPENGSVPAPGLVAGNTLYEHDFFGRDIFGHQMQLLFPTCGVGDRAMITACGAYTMTNGRRFNRIPMPREFVLDEKGLSPITHVDDFC